MGLEERTKEASTMLDEALKELGDILLERSPELGLEKIRRWKDSYVKKIGQIISPKEAEGFQNKRRLWTSGDPAIDLKDDVSLYRNYLIAFKDDIEKKPENYLNAQNELPEKPKTKKTSKLNRVFIIHGHDEVNTLKLEKMLKQEWELDSIILKDEAGGGRTLIEKFEQEAEKAGYAFALLTPDDFVKTSENKYAQARPNVIFELGWFYGKLGRESVCILLQEKTKLHSDLNGISLIFFNKSVEEKVSDIKKELKKAGVIK